MRGARSGIERGRLVEPSVLHGEVALGRGDQPQIAVAHDGQPSARVGQPVQVERQHRRHQRHRVRRAAGRGGRVDQAQSLGQVLGVAGQAAPPLQPAGAPHLRRRVGRPAAVRRHFAFERCPIPIVVAGRRPALRPPDHDRDQPAERDQGPATARRQRAANRTPTGATTRDRPGTGSDRETPCRSSADWAASWARSAPCPTATAGSASRC